MAGNPAAIARTQEKFKSFTIHNVPYQQVNGQDITTDIFIPKDLTSGKHPLIVRFHGGFLITGSSLNAAIFQPWILDYASRHSAILVSPNYLKLPESSGLDILDNLAAFWDWLRSELQPLVEANTEPTASVDLSQILVIGHSAGGYLAAQSALTQPAGSIKAVIMAYPMLDMRSPLGKQPLGRPLLPSSIIDDHLATMKPDKVIAELPLLPPERRDLAMAAVQHHKFPNFLGNDRSLYPLERLAETSDFPPLFIYHGMQDSAVDVVGTEKFVRSVKDKLGGADLVVKLEEGDHGFDTMAGLEEPWLKEGLDMVTGRWLA